MVKKIKQESGDIIIVNWDTIGHMAGWIDALYKTSKDLPNCGGVTALVLDSKQKIFNHGGFISPGVHCPASYAMGEDFFNQYPGTREVEVSHFICGIIKKALLDKLPLPDNFGENPFVDADYCLEAQKLGFKIYATTEVIVQYAGVGNSGMTQEEYAKNFAKDYQEFNKKWGPIYDKKLKLPVMYHTSVAQPSGFAMAARGYIKGLTQNGVKIAYNFLKGTNEEEGEAEDEIINSICEYHGDLSMPQVIWAQAPYFNKNSGKYKIGHCEFEGDWLPSDWVESCNLMDEIWCPTNWDREKFRKAGVNVPIYVFAQGIDKNYFHPDMAPMRFEAPEKFKFLCSAAWDPRKNLPGLIKAFKSEFTKDEDVCLVIKTANLGLTKSIQNEINEIKYAKDSAQVYVKEEILNQEAIGCLYTASDCFVLPTHGEGWGLPIFEALACGLPVITTGWGAPNEVLRDDKGEALPGVHFLRYQKTITDTPYVYLQGNHWAEPSIPHLMETMRAVYANAEAEKALAKETSKIIRQKFDWSEVTKPIKERIKEIYQTKL